MSTLAVDNITDSSGTKGPTFSKGVAFYNSPQVLTEDYTIPTGLNSMTAGPIEVSTGVTIEVSTGSTWTVV